MSDQIRTQRLTLRRPVPQDAAAMAALVGDLDVARWLTRVPHPYTLQDARAFIDRVSGDDGATFVICVNTQLVGCVSTQGQLGYWLGKNHWGRGYATEACRAMITRHFAQGHDELDSGYFTYNAASRHVLEKLGFVRTSQKQARCPATGDSHVLQGVVLLRSMWEGAA
ncbi:MAG: GNAT family N-acetyltransferase [Pseudomonadota bacterium]